jgi:glycosyltransferase involved in cell wall biosynthesis
VTQSNPPAAACSGDGKEGLDLAGREAMRVLVVTPYPIRPPSHGGRARTFGLATGLAQAGADVDVLCPWRPGLPPRSFSADDVTCYPHFFIGNLLPAVLPATVVPSQVALSWQPFSLGPRHRLRAVADYDLVEFHFCAYPALMERVGKVAKVVYAAHNVEYDYFRMQASRARIRAAMADRIWTLEQRTVRASDLVLACTNSDARRLRHLYTAVPPIEVVPAGFEDALLNEDHEYLRQRGRASIGVTSEHVVLLFIGGPAPHNREAVDMLEREIMPQLSRQVHLVVAGECAVPNSPADPRVHHLGFTEDLRPIFAAADIGVNPVSLGCGTNHKVAQYLGAGLPVVTTATGVRGYESISDRLHVGEPRDLASIITAVDPRRRPEPPIELSWREIGRRLYGVYEGLLREADGHMTRSGDRHRTPSSSR